MDISWGRGPCEENQMVFGRQGWMEGCLLKETAPCPLSPPVVTPCISLADGLAAFRAFLKTEFSEENLEFWLACEDFKKTRSAAKLASKAQRIFEEFIDVQAPREVNIDFQTRELTRRNMQEPSLSCFDQAQGKVHSLMEKDSYPRFLRSKIYTDLLSQTQRRLS
uniref:Regulator of G-protein signaling 8 n=1 Tax=Strix occidentalis caurina TaxID=311401 RepID=A0A8D0EJH9_STROC